MNYGGWTQEFICAFCKQHFSHTDHYDFDTEVLIEASSTTKDISVCRNCVTRQPNCIKCGAWICVPEILAEIYNGQKFQRCCNKCQNTTQEN